MKVLLAGITVLLIAVGCVTEESRVATDSADFRLRLILSDSPFPLTVEEGNNRAPVRIMERVDSQELREFLPGYTASRLISTRSPIHYANAAALLLDTNGVPSLLKCDEEVQLFFQITIRTNMQSASVALQLVRLFADLRSYKIIESPPKWEDRRPKAEQPAPESNDFKFVAEDGQDCWKIYASFLTSTYSGSCERYVFTINKNSGGNFHFKEPVLIRLRNYVY